MHDPLGLFLASEVTPRTLYSFTLLGKGGLLTQGSVLIVQNCCSNWITLLVTFSSSFLKNFKLDTLFFLAHLRSPYRNELNTSITLLKLPLLNETHQLKCLWMAPRVHQRSPPSCRSGKLVYVRAPEGVVGSGSNSRQRRKRPPWD